MVIFHSYVSLPEGRVSIYLLAIKHAGQLENLYKWRFNGITWKLRLLSTATFDYHNIPICRTFTNFHGHLEGLRVNVWTPGLFNFREMVIGGTTDSSRIYIHIYI